MTWESHRAICELSAARPRLQARLFPAVFASFDGATARLKIVAPSSGSSTVTRAATVPRPYACGERKQRVELVQQRALDHVEVGHRGAIRVDTEEQLAVVGEDGECERMVGGERDERQDPAQAGAERVERELRPWDVRDGDVEQPCGEEHLRDPLM